MQDRRKQLEQEFEMFLKGMIFQDFKKRAQEANLIGANKIGVKNTEKGVMLEIPAEYNAYKNLSKISVDGFAESMEKILSLLKRSAAPCKTNITD